MRSQVGLPDYFYSNVLSDPKVKHRFFYKVDQNLKLYDFQSPLSDDLARALLHDLNLNRLLVLSQNHTPHVIVYPSKDGNQFADAIITNQKHVGLLIRHADCQAALFFDPVSNVIAATHAGFRGQVHQIYKKTIHKMIKTYGSKPQNIKVAISAGLGISKAEFINYKEEFPESMHGYANGCYMDLKKMAHDELISAGILDKNIQIDPTCTYEREDLYFSYRRDKTKMRMASIISLC